jgi:hypothetical protein
MANKINLAELIREAADCTDELFFRKNYSGRGMFGRKCVALTGDLRDIQKAIGEVHKSLVDHLFDAMEELFDLEMNSEEQEQMYATRNEVLSAIETLARWKIDSMGLSQVVYWENIQDDSDNSDDEDDE